MGLLAEPTHKPTSGAKANCLTFGAHSLVTGIHLLKDVKEKAPWSPMTPPIGFGSHGSVDSAANKERF